LVGFLDLDTWYLRTRRNEMRWILRWEKEMGII
jgi:hypothetical protein